jgi:hypothetical protein
MAQQPLCMGNTWLTKLHAGLVAGSKPPLHSHACMVEQAPQVLHCHSTTQFPEHVQNAEKLCVT